MAKKICDKAELDKDVERYLADPITLNDIRSYEIRRETGHVTMLTVTLYVDMERFEKER